MEITFASSISRVFLNSIVPTPAIIARCHIQRQVDVNKQSVYFLPQISYIVDFLNFLLVVASGKFFVSIALVNLNLWLQVPVYWLCKLNSLSYGMVATHFLYCKPFPVLV